MSPVSEDDYTGLFVRVNLCVEVSFELSPYAASTSNDGSQGEHHSRLDYTGIVALDEAFHSSLQWALFSAVEMISSPTRAT